MRSSMRATTAWREFGFLDRAELGSGDLHVAHRLVPEVRVSQAPSRCSIRLTSRTSGHSSTR